MWMLLHGFMGSPQSWGSVVSLAEFRDPPLVPMLMGHGPEWKHNRVASFEEEVDRLLASAAPLRGPRYLCGYSMGARLALGMLVKGSDLFDGAVLIGVHPGLDDPEARAERRATDAERARMLRSDGVAAFVDTWEDQALFASQKKLPEETLAQQRETRLAHDAEGLAASLEVLGLAAMPSYSNALSSLDVPITLIAGESDTKFANIVREFSFGPHPRHLVGSVGHNVVLEKPQWVAKTLRTMEHRAHE